MSKQNQNPKSKKKIRKKKEKDAFKPRRIKVRIVGLGGGAASIVAEIAEFLKGPSFVVADTDQRSFKKLGKNVKGFSFGQELTRGWGTGMNPAIAEKAAEKAKEKITKLFEGIDLVFLISCLGGGLGSGAAPIFAQILKEEKKISIGIFTLPFGFEGEKKMRLAKNSLKELKKHLSGTIVMPNEEILKLSDKKAPLKKSLSLVNQILINYLRDLVEIIYFPGLINLDFADLRTILKGRGQALCFGQGIGQGPTRTADALKSLFENPFFELFFRGGANKIRPEKIMFNISAGDDLGLKEVEETAEAIYKLNTRAKIIFGISQNPKLKKKIKITLLAVGEDFSGEEGSVSEKRPSIEEEKKGGGAGRAGSRRAETKVKGKPGRKKPEHSGRLGKARSEKKTRRNGLEIKRERDKEEEEEWLKETDWEIPTFLRKKIK